MKGWIGVDLDGTLATYHGWAQQGDGTGFIGAPVPAMAERCRGALADGKELRIITARCHVGNPHREAEALNIAGYTLEHLGRALKAQAEKDFGLIELWDDRVRQVIPNTGLFADEWALAQDVQRQVRGNVAHQNRSGGQPTSAILRKYYISLTTATSEPVRRHLTDLYKGMGYTVAWHPNAHGGTSFTLYQDNEQASLGPQVSRCVR